MNAWLIIGLLSLVVAALSGLLIWRKLRRCDRLIVMLLCMSVSQELISFTLTEYSTYSNIPSFHVYSPFELLIISLYFKNVAHYRWQRRLALGLGIAGCCFSAINTLFLQPLSIINTNFLLIEATIIIMLSLLHLSLLVFAEETVLLRTFSFWAALLFLMYWSVTFVGYGLLGSLLHPTAQLTKAIGIVLRSANICLYLGFALCFLFYRFFSKAH